MVDPWFNGLILYNEQVYIYKGCELSPSLQVSSIFLISVFRLSIVRSSKRCKQTGKKRLSARKREFSTERERELKTAVMATTPQV